MPFSHPHEKVHLTPLRRRFRLVDPEHAKVVVQADTRKPTRGAWNVQIFHGLGDKGYTGNPLFLQKGRMPRLRTAANVMCNAVGIDGPFLRAPANPGKRMGRYQQVNAYGPRLRDHLEDTLDTYVSTYGHVVLNELPKPKVNPKGPVLWLPSWDNRKFLGKSHPSSLEPFHREVILAAREIPFQVRYHPNTVNHEQNAQARARLKSASGVKVVSQRMDPYRLLDGVRAVFTDSSSLGFEAYCLGIPVGVAHAKGVATAGLHKELEERCPVLESGKPDLIEWARSPDRTSDQAWLRDLLFAPSIKVNDKFAQELQERA